MKTRQVMVAVAIGLASACSVGIASAAPDFGVTRPTSFDSFFDYFTPPNRFYIDSSDRSETLRFKTERRIRVCDEAKSMNMGLDVSRRHITTTIEPGSCLSLSARNVVIEPAGRLPDGMSLVGRMKMMPAPSRKG